MASISNQTIEAYFDPKFDKTSKLYSNNISTKHVNGKQDSTYNGLFVHTMDGLPSSPLKGPYTYKIRKQRAPRGPRKLGVARKDKLSFEAVEDEKKGEFATKDVCNQFAILKSYL
jgi:hypothetical protein